MVAELRAAGFDVAPARLEITGDLPRGTGLSSSAALEAALALALLNGPPEDLKALAKLCSKVENEWVGAETGLLDQIASLMSRPGHVLRIDFRSLDVEPHPLDLGDWQLVTLDSGATHSIAALGLQPAPRRVPRGRASGRASPRCATRRSTASTACCSSAPAT